ncbi:MAG: hemolysin III family protein [Opitutales bacterium]|nr:hemolysin III family protein [Opitutales bacterium]
MKELHPTSGFSPAEEIANSITHGVGLALALVGLAAAVVVAGLSADALLVTATAVYGASIVALYLASTLYHSARNPVWKRRFLVLDHSCIFILIAGTYTPFVVGPLRGPVGWTLLGIIWGLAAAGIARECFARKRGGPGSALIYLAMGWLCVWVIVPLWVNLPRPSFVMLFIGGILYSVGVAFYLYRRLPYHHAIWHLWVMAGSVVHYSAVIYLLIAWGDAR